MMCRRQCVLLVPSLLRALPRVQLAVGASCAFGLVWLLSAEPDGARAVVALQYAALALSLGVASILEDDAADTVAAVPPSLLFRRVLTIAIVVPAFVVTWAALMSLSAVATSSAPAITLQVGTLVLVTIALGAALTRGGAISGPLVVIAFLGADAFAPDWALAPDLGDWRWDAIWAGLGAGALLALLVVSRDPARRVPRLQAPSREPQREENDRNRVAPRSSRRLLRSRPCRNPATVRADNLTMPQEPA